MGKGIKVDIAIEAEFFAETISGCVDAAGGDIKGLGDDSGSESHTDEAQEADIGVGDARISTADAVEEIGMLCMKGCIEGLEAILDIVAFAMLHEFDAHRKFLGFLFLQFGGGFGLLQLEEFIFESFLLDGGVKFILLELGESLAVECSFAEGIE